jgi:hypothetical protein
MKTLLISYTSIVAFLMISIMTAIILPNNSETSVALDNTIDGIYGSADYCRITRSELDQNPLKTCNTAVGGYLGGLGRVEIGPAVTLNNATVPNPVDTRCSVIQWDGAQANDFYVQYSADAWNYCHYEMENDYCQLNGVRGAFNNANLSILKTQFEQKCSPVTPTATVRPTSTPTLRPTSTPTLRPTSTPTLRPTSTPTLRPTSTPTVKPLVCTQWTTQKLYSGEFIASKANQRSYDLGTVSLSAVAKKYPIAVRTMWGWTGATDTNPQIGNAFNPRVQNNENHTVSIKYNDLQSSATKTQTSVCEDLGNTKTWDDGVNLLDINDPRTEYSKFKYCRKNITPEVNDGVASSVTYLNLEGKYDSISLRSDLNYTKAEFDSCVNNFSLRKCNQSHYSLVEVVTCAKEG